MTSEFSIGYLDGIIVLGIGFLVWIIESIIPITDNMILNLFIPTIGGIIGDIATRIFLPQIYSHSN